MVQTGEGKINFKNTRMLHKQINGVNIIHYNPTGLEYLLNKMQALKIKEQLEKEKVGLPKYTNKEKKQIKKDWEEVVARYSPEDQYLSLSTGK